MLTYKLDLTKNKYLNNHSTLIKYVKGKSFAKRKK